jgi:hypothetical protein
MAVALPHRQGHQAFALDPDQVALGVARRHLAAEAIDQEDEAQPSE